MPFKKGHKFGNRFQPGVSGNPSGRPKKLITDKIIAKLLASNEELAHAVAQAAIRHARHSPRGMGELLDRVEGKVPAIVEGNLSGVVLLKTSVPRPKRDKP